MVRERTRRRPHVAPGPSALSDDELFERLRELPPDAPEEGGSYRDELIARLRDRLYRFFRSRAASSRLAVGDPHDLAEDLAQETILRVASDRATARDLLADAPGGPDGPRPARLDFPRVRHGLLVYAFGTARRVWASYASAATRQRARRSELPAAPDAPSPWDQMEQAETEAEWERRMRYGERLRAAEADCAGQLAGTAPPPRAARDAYALAAELWLWCSHGRGTAAAFYAARGAGGRNTTRDLNAAERLMRACLQSKGIEPALIDALCDHVRRRARGGAA